MDPQMTEAFNFWICNSSSLCLKKINDKVENYTTELGSIKKNQIIQKIKNLITEKKNLIDVLKCRLDKVERSSQLTGR